MTTVHESNPRQSKTLIHSAVELISVHIPKTAGSTFGQVLAQVYGDEQVFFDPTGYSDPQETLSTISPGIKVIHGHFQVHKYRNYFLSAKRIVWLRHPINRLLSHYFYLKSFSEVHNSDPIHRLVLEKNISLVEFAGQEGIYNVFSGFTEGLPLQKFDFVGIQEYFFDDLIDLRKVLNWSNFQGVVRTFNKNPYPDYQEFCSQVKSDLRIMEQLNSILHKDLELYQTALKLREERKIRLRS